MLSSLGGKGEGGCARAGRSLDSFSRWARGECWSNFCAENSLFFGCLRGARVGKEQVNASPCFFFPFHLLEQACDEREVRRWLEGGKLFSSCNAIHGHKHAGLYEDEEENGRARARMRASSEGCLQRREESWQRGSGVGRAGFAWHSLVEITSRQFRDSERIQIGAAAVPAVRARPSLPPCKAHQPIPLSLSPSSSVTRSSGRRRGQHGSLSCLPHFLSDQGQANSSKVSFCIRPFLFGLKMKRAGTAQRALFCGRAVSQ